MSDLHDWQFKAKEIGEWVIDGFTLESRNLWKCSQCGIVVSVRSGHKPTSELKSALHPCDLVIARKVMES